ncbi:MAG: TPR repeat protein [Alteromonadaceae bacterium]|jgi:TPR repeat protein
MKTITCLSVLLSILLSFSASSFDADLELGIFKLNKGEFKAAIEKFEPLVLEGYSPAQYQMALIYQNGYGVQKDQQKAFELFSLAASQNYPDALFNLAVMYSEGKVVDKNLTTAFVLYEKAANKGLASAQFNIGVAYYNGEGVQKDYLKASRWYRKAAEQNYALAQFNLALMYFEGQGVPKSTENSYIWNIISSYNGYVPADKSRIIDESKLNGDQIQQARDEANRIYKNILAQEEIKNKEANKKFY